MGAMASQITSLTIVYSTVHSGVDQRKHQSSASLAFVWEIHRWPVNSPLKWPVTRKMLPFDDIIIHWVYLLCPAIHCIHCFVPFPRTHRLDILTVPGDQQRRWLSRRCWHDPSGDFSFSSGVCWQFYVGYTKEMRSYLNFIFRTRTNVTVCNNHCLLNNGHGYEDIVGRIWIFWIDIRRTECLYYFSSASSYHQRTPSTSWELVAVCTRDWYDLWHTAYR